MKEIFDSIWLTAVTNKVDDCVDQLGLFVALLNKKLDESNLFAFIEQTKLGSQFIVIAEKSVITTMDGNKIVVPCEYKAKTQKVSILLAWGLNSEFLNNLESWGHDKCSYKVDDVHGNVIDILKEESETNYWHLYDAVVGFKETDVWYVEPNV